VSYNGIRYVIEFLTSVFDFIQLLRERSQLRIREVAYLEKDRDGLWRIAYSDLYSTCDKHRERLGMYLQKKRYRHDPLRFVQSVREVVVELGVEAEYLKLREQKTLNVFRDSRLKNFFLF